MSGKEIYYDEDPIEGFWKALHKAAAEYGVSSTQYKDLWNQLTSVVNGNEGFEPQKKLDDA